MNLVESVEDIVVSALAEQDKFSSWQLYSPPPKEPDSSVVTRDIIHALADLLNEEFPDVDDGKRFAWDVDDLIQWLRSQANLDSAGSD